MYILVRDRYDDEILGVITCKQISTFKKRTIERVQEEMDKIMNQLGDDDYYISEVVAQLPIEWGCTYTTELNEVYV